MSSEHDNIYAEPMGQPGLFRFDEKVASVFPDMIRRSVPGYNTIIAMTGLIAARHAQHGSALYDLGCSLGASTLAMRQNLRASDCRIIAVDNSQAMLQRCRSVSRTRRENWRKDQSRTQAGCCSRESLTIARENVNCWRYTSGCSIFSTTWRGRSLRCALITTA